MRGKYDALLMDRSRAYMYISTSRTMGTPNRRRTGPHLSPPQALMVETSRAGLRAGSSSCAKESQSTHQRLDETLIFRLRLSCARRISSAHFDTATGRCREMRLRDSFLFARGCVPFSDAMSIRHVQYTTVTAASCPTYYSRTLKSADATLSDQEHPRVAS